MLLWATDNPAALAASQRLAPLLAGIEDPYLRAMTQLVVAWTSPIAGDHGGALRQALVALQELRSQDEPYWTAVAALSAGYLETAAGRYDDALLHGREDKMIPRRPSA
jgi:hypothetical protein